MKYEQRDIVEINFLFPDGTSKPHPLEGDYNDCMECHIQSDYLLIWYDKEKDVIKLIRLGSHSELFK